MSEQLQQSFEIDPQSYLKQIADTFDEKLPEITEQVKAYHTYVMEKAKFVKDHFYNRTVVNKDNSQEFYLFNPQLIQESASYQETEQSILIAEHVGKTIPPELKTMMEEINEQILRTQQRVQALFVMTDAAAEEYNMRVDTGIIQVAGMVFARHSDNVMRTIMQSLREGALSSDVVNMYAKSIDENYNEVKRWLEFNQVPMTNIEDGYRYVKDLIQEIHDVFLCNG